MSNSSKTVHTCEQTRANVDMVKKVASTLEEADILRMFPSFVWKTQLKEEIIKKSARTPSARLNCCDKPNRV